MFVWILPLFPAEPKLGPVYQRVTRLVPPLTAGRRFDEEVR